MSPDFRAGLITGALAVLVAAFAIVAVSKAETSLIGSGLALHTDGKEHCNSKTYGLGIEEKSGNWRDMFGFYKNSNCRWSAYVGRAWTPLCISLVCAGPLAGVVTGYENKLTPVGGIAAAVETKPVGLSIIFIPMYHGSGGVLWFNLRYPFQ